MARPYRLTLWRRVANALIRALHQVGLAPPHNYLLTVRGRVTGRPHQTPVQLVERDGQRWLVAPYGEVNWVKNVRAAGTAGLRRNGRVETIRLVEFRDPERAQILKTYLEETPITQPYFDAQPDPPLDAFLAEADKHPIFRVLPANGTESPGR